jgi:MFS transporter, PPP family, 3-phenylpropionic acid transporter
LAVAFLILPPRLILYTLPWGPWWVTAVQSLHGFNFGIMGAVEVVMANDLSGNSTRGQAQARIFAAAGAAGAISPVVFGTIAKGAGMEWMFAAASLIALVAAVMFMLKVQDSLPQSEPIASRFPAPLQNAAKWLDAPQFPPTREPDPNTER